MNYAYTQNIFVAAIYSSINATYELSFDWIEYVRFEIYLYHTCLNKALLILILFVEAIPQQNEDNCDQYRWILWLRTAW